MWFKVDDKLHDHRKVRPMAMRELGRAALGVWTLAGSWCADNLTDGFVPASVLVRWGTPDHAQLLVEAGLWRVDAQDGEDGWRFHDWDLYQPLREDVQAEREATRRRVQKHRDRRGATPAPKPDPTTTWTNEELDRIRVFTGGTRAHARKTADFILAKTSATVRNRINYVLTAIQEEPDAYRYRRGNPTKAQECRTHPGEWSDACRGCAIDARLEGK